MMALRPAARASPIPAPVRQASSRSVPTVVARYAWTIEGLPRNLAHHPAGKTLQSPPFSVDLGDGLPPFMCYLSTELHYLTGEPVAEGTGASALLTFNVDFETLRPRGRIIDTDMLTLGFRKWTPPVEEASGVLQVQKVSRHQSMGLMFGDLFARSRNSAAIEAKVVKCQHDVLRREGLISEDKLELYCEISVRQSISEAEVGGVEKEEEEEKAQAAGTAAAHKALTDDLGRMLGSGIGADVHFVVGGVTLSAHRCILAARSPVFAALFRGEYAEGGERSSDPVDVLDMDGKVFSALLRYIYTGSAMSTATVDADESFRAAVAEGEEAELTTEFVQHLLAAADRYDVPSLRDECGRLLMRCGSLAPDTVAYTLTLAHQHGIAGLKQACVKFAAKHVEAVTESEGWRHLVGPRALSPAGGLKAWVEST